MRITELTSFKSIAMLMLKVVAAIALYLLETALVMLASSFVTDYHHMSLISFEGTTASNSMRGLAIRICPVLDDLISFLPELF